jgi:Glycosyltransferase family 92
MANYSFLIFPKLNRNAPGHSRVFDPPSRMATMRSAPTQSPPFAWYLTIVAIFQNEARNLEEWLAFCVLEGADHILLYDNSSTDDSREVLQPWIAAGVVELVDWPVHWKNGSQSKAYIDALHRLRGSTRWAAFIDVDEFLFSPSGNCVSEVLKRYEGHAGVVVNWQCYGTSGRSRRPEGLTIENYTRRAKTRWARNRRVKTIVDPALAIEPRSAHLFKVQPGHSLVTEDFKSVRLVRAKNGRRRLRHLAAWLPYLPFDPYSVIRPHHEQVSVSELRINHYATRSEEDLASKYKNRDGMGDRDRRSHSRYHDRNEVEDPVLVSKAGRVREIIARMRAASRTANSTD